MFSKCKLAPLSLVLAVSLVVPRQSMAAATFPDVPYDHLYNAAIENLVNAGVVNGNPDGYFYPDNIVNRAEMMKMLYLASGRTPDASVQRCFPDVPPGAWFESYVCDAAANRFVAGYADGYFRPEKSVNRVEALKMIIEIFEIDMYPLSDKDKDVINFADVSPSAWYGQYLFTAFDIGILPIAGQNGAFFYPSSPLTRGEAAAYIHNALNADLRIRRSQQSSAVSSVDSSSSASSKSSQSSSTKEEKKVTNLLEVHFPFTSGGKFEKTKPFAYEFDITDNSLVYTDAYLQAGQPGTLRCTLYLLNEDGLAHEYYLGTEEANHCYFLTSLTPGRYQLQLVPSNPDTTYKVSSQISTSGDGNDGFSEAKHLTQNNTTDVLDSNNFQNWYKFSLSSETSMTTELTNGADLRCVIYSMEDVDLYGFTGPECGKVYSYPPGTYFVAVGRDRAPRSKKITYSIRLK